MKTCSSLEDDCKNQSRDLSDFLDLTPCFMSAKDPKSLFLDFHFSVFGHKLADSAIECYLKVWK